MDRGLWTLFNLLCVKRVVTDVVTEMFFCAAVEPENNSLNCPAGGILLCL